MTDLLLRLFVRNHENSADAEVRTGVGTLAGLVGILCNLLLFAGKLTAGILSGALSIVADAVNNLSDAASSVITLLGFRMARRPADREHPFGHARIEYLAGLAVSMMILVIGTELGLSSVRKILNPTTLNLSFLSCGILVGSMAVKYWMGLFFRTLGKKISSLVLEATAQDCRNDALMTATVLGACLFSQIFHKNVDGWVGLGVAVFIFWSGIRVAGETISPLLGRRADPELVQRLSQLVLSHEQILGIHDLLVHDYGPGQCFASLHAELDAREDPLDCHDIIDEVECQALRELGIHLVIHYDPVEVNDEEWNRLHRLVDEAVKTIDSSFSVHDFRLIRSKEQTRVDFDLALPYSCTLTGEAIKLSVYEFLLARGEAYPLTIHFDRNL